MWRFLEDALNCRIAHGFEPGSVACDIKHEIAWQHSITVTSRSIYDWERWVGFCGYFLFDCWLGIANFVVFEVSLPRTEMSVKVLPLLIVPRDPLWPRQSTHRYVVVGALRITPCTSCSVTIAWFVCRTGVLAVKRLFLFCCRCTDQFYVPCSSKDMDDTRNVKIPVGMWHMCSDEREPTQNL
jgi:hypothetical protein